MTKHVHAEFFRAIASGGPLLDWEVSFGSAPWEPVEPGHMDSIYCGLVRVRRKPKTSRERFEEYLIDVLGYSARDVELSRKSTGYAAMVRQARWEAWQEAERQAKESSDE